MIRSIIGISLLVAVTVHVGCRIEPIPERNFKQLEIREYVLKNHVDQLTESDREIIARDTKFQVHVYELAAGSEQGGYVGWVISEGRFLKVDYVGALDAPLDLSRVTISIEKINH